MKIAAVIPCRYGSSRFEGKPLALINGKPMIQMVYESASKAKRVTDVVVATDDQRIYDVVNRFGGRALMTSADHRSGSDRVAEAAHFLGVDSQDVVINIQGDQPLVDPRCFDQLVAPFFERPELEMCTLGFQIVDPREYTNPKDVKITCDREGYALYFSRAPIPCPRDPGTQVPSLKHLGVYAYTRHFLDVFRQLPPGHLEEIEKLEQLRALENGHRILVVVTEYDSPEVDLPEDIPRIESLLNR